MLTSNSPNIFYLRGIEKPRAWMIKHGLNPQTAGRLLKNELLQFKVSDIEKLCLGLNCAPADLFQRHPDSKEQDLPNHPLPTIRSTRVLPDVLSKLKSASFDELKLMDELLAKLREGKG